MCIPALNSLSFLFTCTYACSRYPKVTHMPVAGTLRLHAVVIQLVGSARTTVRKTQVPLHHPAVFSHLRDGTLWTNSPNGHAEEERERWQSPLVCMTPRTAGCHFCCGNQADAETGKNHQAVRHTHTHNIHSASWKQQWLVSYWERLTHAQNF